MRLKNKVAIITGSSRGIGKAIAFTFAKEGAYVVVNCVTKKKEAERIVKKIGKNRALFIQADVSNEDGVHRLVSAVVKKFKRVDILVNNAGTIFRSGGWAPSNTLWHSALDANLTSAWLMIREVVPIMKKQGSGIIVNISSIYGFLGSAPVVAYSSAKGGLLTLTRAFAKELAPHIRVNAVAPGNVITDMTREVNQKSIRLFEQQTPLKRSAEPDEIAKAVLFLASSDASFITGETIVVDGGYSLK